MAEGGLFSVATKLLSTLDSLASKGHGSAPIAESDIKKLKSSVDTIRLVLLDAEEQQEGSAAVKGWIRKVRDAFYDADDLFDEILTYGELNQPAEGSNVRNQVRKFLSSSNSIAQAYKFSARVKDLRKSLDLASKDIEVYCFVQREKEEHVCVGTEAYPEELFGVVGRKEEEESVLEFLREKESSNKEKGVPTIPSNEEKGVPTIPSIEEKGVPTIPSNEKKGVPTIAIVGIGGMGKTALARLVYDSKDVQKNFMKKWWASVADKDGDMEILREICEAMTYENTRHVSGQKWLKDRIGKSVEEAGKYLLVIDGARDANHKKWSERLSPLHEKSPVGSKIIVTTRSLTVARTMGAAKTLNLSGLSKDDSWELFRKIAIKPEKEKDSRSKSLGRVIASKCSSVPLAITRIANLLRTLSLDEWETFMTEELPKVELGSNVVISALKLSYDHLPSDLKHCFAYCALFPKDYAISKQKLLYLWIAQGYVSAKEKGDTYCSQLLSVSFLKEAKRDEAGEISHFKMHDLVHDLAQLVARDDVAVLAKHSNHGRFARHVSVTHDIFQSSGSETLLELISMDQLRSFLFLSIGSPLTHRQWGRFQRLRALQLSDLSIEDVPHCLGDFRSLRYLDLSRNPFESLPDSISKLLNLIAFYISGCDKLKAWPKNMRRLIKLRHLDSSLCPSLKQMPDGLGELTCLQYLSDLKTGNDSSALEKLTLKGKLRIDFSEFSDEADERCKLPTTVKMLTICCYSGTCQPRWGDESGAAIVYLELKDCGNLVRLPDRRILWNLKTLVVHNVKGLKYVSDAETTSSACFEGLESLSLVRLPDLKGWSRKGKLEGGVVPHLARLEIAKCEGMELWGHGNSGMDWDSLSTLETLRISPMPPRESLPPCLKERNVRVLEYSFPPPEAAPVERNQTSNDDSVECSTSSQSREISNA